MSKVFVNTIQFRFPMGAPQPSWGEIAEFVKKLEPDVMQIETCYKISESKCVYVKYHSQEAMEKTMRRTTETSQFLYASGKPVEVKMSIAGSDVRYVRVFDLPPEITDDDLSLELSKYGTVERTMREKFPAESGLAHMFTGVRGTYIDIKKEIPPTLVVSSRKGRVFYDGLKNKCFLCLAEGHRKDSCPSRKTHYRSEQRKETEVEQSHSYATVVETGAVSSPKEAEIVDDEIIEDPEEETVKVSETTKGKGSSEITHQNHMDQVCYEKYGITNYTEKLAELIVAVKEHVRKQEASFKDRRAQLVKSDSTEHPPPKKASRKNSK